MRRAAAQRGITLMEMLIVIGIIAVMMGAGIMGFRAVLSAERRAVAGRLAAAIRYSYDRAVSTGAFYRLHFDLEEQSYKLESAKDRVLLTREKERAGRDGVGLDQDKEAARKEADEAQRYGTNQGLPPELLPPPSPRRARFEEFKDTTLPEIKLKRVRILDIYTARQPEPYTKGHAYLHFFPDGHTERAVIHVGSDERDEDTQFSLLVHGLTGRVEVQAGHVRPPADFDVIDDAGNVRPER